MSPFSSVRKTTPAASTASFTFVTVSNLAWKVSSEASSRFTVMAERPASSARRCWLQPSRARAARICRLEIMLDHRSLEMILLVSIKIAKGSTMVQFANVSPVLLVSDVFETAEYYRDVLGFHFNQIYGEPPSFVIVQRDSARLMFRQPRDGAPP